MEDLTAPPGAEIGGDPPPEGSQPPPPEAPEAGGYKWNLSTGSKYRTDEDLAAGKEQADLTIRRLNQQLQERDQLIARLAQRVEPEQSAEDQAKAEIAELAADYVAAGFDEESAKTLAARDVVRERRRVQGQVKEQQEKDLRAKAKTFVEIATKDPRFDPRTNRIAELLYREDPTGDPALQYEEFLRLCGPPKGNLSEDTRESLDSRAEALRGSFRRPSGTGAGFKPDDSQFVRDSLAFYQERNPNATPEQLESYRRRAIATEERDRRERSRQ